MASPDDAGRPATSWVPPTLLGGPTGLLPGVVYGRGRLERVVMHPPVTLHTEPALLFTFRPPAGTTAADVRADVRPLFDLLAARWKADCGGDLKSEVTQSRHGQFYWVVSAERGDGANDRMKQLGDPLTTADPPAEVGERWRPLADKYRPSVVVQRGS